MKRYGRASLSEFLDDFIVYRNLIPVDTSLPALVDIAEELGIKKGVVPRKTSEEYALVMVQLLQAARKMELTQSEITRIVMVGDTLMNDGTAFRNICRVGGWQGIAFIGSERKERKSFQVEEYVGSKIYISNRWSGLQEFNHFCRQNDFEINGNSAVLVDIDKTAVGARGRNDKVIDEVRVQAAIDTASSLLGEDYDPNSFDWPPNTPAIRGPASGNPNQEYLSDGISENIISALSKISKIILAYSGMRDWTQTEHAGPFVRQIFLNRLNQHLTIY